MTDNDRIISFIEAVLLRPKMYTLGGTYEEVVAFLQGYYSGMARADPRSSNFEMWSSFRRWLANQLAVDSTWVFHILRDKYASNQDAIDGLLERYARFESECPNLEWDYPSDVVA